MIWRGRDESQNGPPEEAGADEVDPGGTQGSVGNRIESVLDAAERAAVGIREDAQEWASRYLEESRRKADESAAERIREISALTDNLVSRARAVAQQSDELIAALDDAGRRMLNSNRPAPPAEVPPVPPTQSERPPDEQMAPPQAPPVREAPPPPPPVREAPAPPPAKAPPAPATQAAPPPPPPQPPAQAPPEAVPPSQAEPGPGAPQVSEGARLLATQMAVAGSTRDEISWRLQEEFGIKDPTPILDEIGI